MDRDFFISLCFATHRVGNLLNAQIGITIKLSANTILSRLILLLEGSLSSAQKKALVKEILQELESLARHLQAAKAQGNINPANFLVLEGEYAKIKQFVQGFVNEREPASVPSTSLRTTAGEASKSLRARKILDLLGSKEKVQVWELQKVMPQVTKRTLRRDLDTLVQKGLLERKGEWNTVFYELKQ